MKNKVSIIFTLFIILVASSVFAEDPQSNEDPMADILNMINKISSSSAVKPGHYVNAEIGFEIDIPKDFNGLMTGDMLIVSESVPSGDSVNFMELMAASQSKPTIMAMFAESEEDDDFLNMDPGEIKMSMREDSEDDVQMTVNSVTKEKFSGNDWVKIITETVNPLGKMKSIAYYTTIGDRSVMLSYTAPASEWDRIKSIFEKNHETLKVK